MIYLILPLSFIAMKASERGAQEATRGRYSSCLPRWRRRRKQCFPREKFTENGGPIPGVINMTKQADPVIHVCRNQIAAIATFPCGFVSAGWDTQQL